jgi:glycosyltransferase involved in cell wall biosynthesis
MTTAIAHFVFMRLMPPVIVWGGLEKLMLEWCERIDYGRCRVTLVVSKGGGEIYARHFKEKNLPVDIVEFPFRINFKYTENFLGRFRKTSDLFKKLKPHAVVFFQGTFTCFDFSHVLAANLATDGRTYMHENLGAPTPSVKSSKKYLGFIPGIGLWWYAERYLTPLRARFSKKVFVVSKEIRERTIEYWHYPPEKVEVLYHGVDVQKFFPSLDVRGRVRSSMGIAPEDIVIIAAARLSQEKCLDRAIDAFDALSREFPQARLLIAGTGPREDQLKNLAAGKHSKDRIRFLGHVNNVNELYQMSDIYVLSSDNEGLSLAFLEALATGLICVATKCTGTTEVIQNGTNGFLVDKNTTAVEEGLRTVLKLPAQQRETISKNAVRHIQENFEINRNMQRALTLLNIPRKGTPQ